MNFKRLFAVITILLSCIAVSHAQVKIIFDTDFGGDADDLGALVMLHNLHNKGECELLGIASWTTEQFAIPAMDAVNRFYGNPDIPMGIRSRGYHFQDWNYNKPIADSFPHKLTNDDAMLAVDLYRKILSEQEDNSVVIVTLGPLKNIEDLIKSGPDKYSPLSGNDLINKKVKKLSIMGGHFPEGKNEWNFNGNMPGVTRFVLENLNVPVIFSGFELGNRIKTGTVFNDIDKNHPLFVGFMHFSQHASWMKDNFKGKILDNASFDQTSVLYAVRGGVGEYWDKVEGGRCVAEENGDNKWVTGEKSNHSYLVLKKDHKEMEKLIINLMLNTF
jgi:hypothetical protein